MTPHGHARAEQPSARDLRRLFSRCSAGDVCARETIILRFLPLAGRIARIYEGRGEPLEDLCQVASVGLIKAVDAYSPERGTFAGYAWPMIQGEIRRHFRDATWRVYVPRQVREHAARVLLAEKDLAATGGPDQPESIATYLGISREDVAEARRALEAHSCRALDASSVGPDGDASPLPAVVGAEEAGYDRAELSVGIQRTLRTLKPREQRVLLLRLAWELSQAEIAGRVGLSQMHVSRILRKAGIALTASCGLNVSARGESRRWSRPTFVVLRTASFAPIV